MLIKTVLLPLSNNEGKTRTLKYQLDRLQI